MARDPLDRPLSPQIIASASREMLELWEATLPKVERRLAAGVYQRGPRKGLPLDRRARRELEAWAERLRRGIPRYRDVAETAEALAASGATDASWLLDETSAPDARPREGA